MPVVLEQGASGRSFNLLNGVRCAPADPSRIDGAIEIGIVNNMPDAALELTERQFIGLLAAASGKMQVRVRLFALPQIGRGEFAAGGCSQIMPRSGACGTRNSMA
jgi:hypothetical protein